VVVDMIESALVTGGAGFIGSHIVDRLVDAGTRTVVLDDLSSGSRQHLHPAASLIEADVADPRAIDIVADVQPEVVIHAAAQVSVPISTEQPERDRRINLVGTENMLSGARRARSRRFVFISSGGAIYGEARMANEETLPAPANPYGIHKLAAEGYVRTSGISFGIARFANIYGPRQRTDLEGGVVAIFVDRLARQEPVTIHGTGDQSRDFVFVGDAVDATIAIAETPKSGIWNVSTGTEVSILGLLSELERIVAPAAAIDRAPRRPGDVEVSSLSSQRIREDLGWHPRHALSDGLAITVGAGRHAAEDSRDRPT
jgi:UDP-glucose 4-epimerase